MDGIASKLEGLPDEHARLLSVRLGLDGSGRKSAAETAGLLGMELAEYRKAEMAAFSAVGGAHRFSV